MAMLALFGVATLAGARFLHRAASALRVTVLVVSGQTLVHLALSGLAGHRGDPAAAPAAAGTARPDVHAIAATTDADGHRVGSLVDQWEAGHAVATGPPADLSGSLTSWAHHLVEHTTAQPPLMLAAHVAGAVALALWLALGERALWHLIHLAAARTRVRGILTRAFAAWSSAPVAPRRLVRPPLAVAPAAVTPLHRRPCRVVVRRGPPALLAG